MMDFQVVGDEEDLSIRTLNEFRQKEDEFILGHCRRIAHEPDMPSVCDTRNHIHFELRPTLSQDRSLSLGSVAPLVIGLVGNMGLITPHYGGLLLI